MIYRFSTLGMTPLFYNCDPRENQGLHMLCPHCLKCFPFIFLGNLSPKSPDCINNQHIRGKLQLSPCLRQKPNTHIEPLSPLCQDWGMYGKSLRRKVEPLLSVFHNPLLPFCSSPCVQIIQVPDYLKLPYSLPSRFQTMKQIEQFLYTWPSLGSIVIAPQSELQP